MLTRTKSATCMQMYTVQVVPVYRLQLLPSAHAKYIVQMHRMNTVHRFLLLKVAAGDSEAGLARNITIVWIDSEVPLHESRSEVPMDC